ncbi:hypothetical protein IAT38_005694 [Cryptococcus sp. DSM 104549]
MSIPQTPAQPSRYPQSLSQAGSGPSRPTRTYPVPSIDSSIASPPLTSAPLHEYTSLQELLQKAGYKETRVYTPEAEKVRRHIKRTLDDNEDEVAALYGTYGFDRERGVGLGIGGGNGLSGLGMEVQHKNVTEPILPMKRSTSILRSLALQDATERTSTSVEVDGTTPDHSWWAAWGKYGKGVSSPEAPAQVGLGLAKSGDGVRKVKSAWEIERSRPRRAGTDSPQQEERPPLPLPRLVSDPREMAATGYTPTKAPTSRPIDKSIFASPPPPPSIPDDAYGYCPLPDDYEAQCAEDEALYAMGVNDYDIYSLGSGSATESVRSGRSGHSMAEVQAGRRSRSPSRDRSRSRTTSEERAERQIREFEDEMEDELLDEVNDVGKRLLEGAVEYDEDFEFDSPPMREWSLPKVHGVSVAPRIPTPATPEAETTVKPKVEEVKKPLKYGDRATKLRLAHSTPNLKQAEAAAPPLPAGWLGSIRSALLGPSPATSTLPIPPPLPHRSTSPPGPFKLSAAAPAQPKLVTASPVVCDSLSAEAEDLPPVPTPTAQAPSGPISSIALRLRPSLAKLRDAVYGPQTVAVDGSELVLSPRLDWKQQGEEFAGWSPARKPTPGKGKGEASEGAVEEVEIDYTKSFFYKPSTPPRVNGAAPETPKSKPSSSSASSATPHGPRKQRSIKSLRAALLLPVAPTAVPPVPAIPIHLATPKRAVPVLAIQSPMAKAPRELVLEGEEWDAREGAEGGRRGRGSAKKGNSGAVRGKKTKKKSSLRE